MLDITAEASAKLLEYLKEHNIESAIRVFVSAGSCSGPALALALDEQKPTDATFSITGLRFLVESDLLSQCGTIQVAYVDAGDRAGFTIKSSTPLPGGGCSSGACSSKGCGC